MIKTDKQIYTILTMGASGSTPLAYSLHYSGVKLGEKCDKVDGNQGWASAVNYVREVPEITKYYKYTGNYCWDFSEAINTEPSQKFIDNIMFYLSDIMNSDYDKIGWKIPYTLPTFPWLLKMFPDIKIIINVRDPRDYMFQGKTLGTNFFSKCRIENANIDDDNKTYLKTALSWKLGYDLIRQTIEQTGFKNYFYVRLEDFTFDQIYASSRISDFLGFEFKPIPIRSHPLFKNNSYEKFDVPLQGFPVGKHLFDKENTKFDFLKENMDFFGYSDGYSERTYWLPKNEKELQRMLKIKEIEDNSIDYKEVKKLNAYSQGIFLDMIIGDISQETFETNLKTVKEKYHDQLRDITESVVL